MLEHFTVPQIQAALAQQVALSQWVVFSVPSVYYPFEPEFGDERLLPIEEWQRILAPFAISELTYYGDPNLGAKEQILCVLRGQPVDDTDIQGNVRALVSIGGVVTDSYAYKAFGEELAICGSTVNFNRYNGLNGYYRDIPNRLYVRARYLDVVKGRWITKDPVGLQLQSDNLYKYVSNVPTIAQDPSGLDIIPIIGQLFACGHFQSATTRTCIVGPCTSTESSICNGTWLGCSDCNFNAGQMYTVIQQPKDLPACGSCDDRETPDSVECAMQLWFFSRSSSSQ